MNRMIQSWKIAQKDLQLDIIAPFKFQLNNGEFLEADVLVKNFGASKGMLVFKDSAVINPYSKMVVEMGYGYTSYLEPADDSLYDRESFIEMLSDWGWGGQADLQPSWIIQIPLDEE